MAQSTGRRKTTRTAVDLGGPASPRLEQQRHFNMRPDRTGERNAEALQKAFAVGVDAYGAKLERDNLAGSKQAVTEAGAGGTRNEDEGSIAYQRTWDKLDDQRSLQKAATDLPAYLADNNAENMTEEERQKLVNSWMESKHKGLDDPAEKRGYGRDRLYLSEGLLELEATEMLKYRNLDLERLRTENNSESFEALRQDYMDTEGEVDYTNWMDRTDEFNEGSDKTRTFWNGLFSLAKETGDMSILANVPDKFPNGDPTHLNNPDFQAALEQAKSQTLSTHNALKKAAEDSYKATFQSELALAHSLDKQLASSGDPQVLENIAMGGVPGPNGEPPRYKQGQQTALYDSYFKTVAEGTVTRGLVQDFTDGNLIGGTPEDYEAGFNGYMAAISKNIDEGDEEYTPEEKEAALRKMAIERSVVNKRFPKVLKDQMTVNIRNPEKFKDAAELYNQSEAQLPGFAETQIGDKQSMMLATYNRLLEETGSEQGALQKLEAYEPGRHKLPEFNEDDMMTDAVAAAVDSLADKPWSVFDYEQTSRLQVRVGKQIKHYIDMGYDLDQAQDFAVTAINARSTRAGDYLYEKDAGWGEKPDAELQWAIENEAAHLGKDPESIRVRPHPHNPKMILIEDMTAVLPGSGTEYRISDLSAGYSRWTGELVDRRLEASKVTDEEKWAEATKRAYEDMFPPNPYGKSGDRQSMAISQRKQWDALGISDRNRLIEQQIIN